MNFCTQFCFPVSCLPLHSGWPRPIHQDDLDGGYMGANRTRCSGTQEISTVVGFLSDKSLGEEFETLPYAPGLNCTFIVTAPANLVKQQAAGTGWGGIRIGFQRFDLGEFSSVTLVEVLNMPSTQELKTMNTTTAAEARDSIPDDVEDLTWGAFLIPDVTPAERVVAVYTRANPPPIENFVVAKEGMSFYLRFETSLQPESHVGTGWKLEYAIAKPDPHLRTARPAWANRTTHTPFATYSAPQGMFWFDSFHEERLDKMALVLPVSRPEQQVLSFTVSFAMYPNNRPELWSSVLLEVLDLASGQIVYTVGGTNTTSSSSTNTGAQGVDGALPPSVSCTGTDMFTRGYQSPRCLFLVNTGAVVLRFTSLTAESVISVVGEWVTTGYCNTPLNDPHILSAPVGWVTDESGPNRFLPLSDCSWYIRSSDPSVLFVTITFWEFDTDSFFVDHLFVQEDVPNVNVTATRLVADLTSSLVPTQPDGSIVTLHSSGPSLRLHFVTSPNDHGTGFNASYRMVLPPVPESLLVQGVGVLQSAEISAALSSVSSHATGLLYAGVTFSTATISGTDTDGTPAPLGYSDWFRFFLRFVPRELNVTEDVMEEIQHYPLELKLTNESYWAQFGFLLTQHQLDQIFEYEFVASTLDYIAPQKGGIDYVVSCVYVLNSHGAMPDTISGMRQSSIDPEAFTMLPYVQTVRITAGVVDPAHSSFFISSPLPSSAPAAESVPCSMLDSYGRLCNPPGNGSNAAFEVGQPLSFTLVTRDKFGNRMENLLSRDDVRTFLRRKTTSASPPTLLTQISGGVYGLRINPSQAGTDYTLTVMVSGSDVKEGPFHPVLLASATDPAACTLTNAANGLSVLTYALPVGRVVLLLTLRDRFGNVQEPGVASRDEVLIDWPGHDLQLLSRNHSELRWSVLLQDFEVGSLMSVLVNSQPLGYDPTSFTRQELSNGISIDVGTAVISAYSQPMAMKASFIFFSVLMIVLTLLLGGYVYLLRGYAPIRASAPRCLGMMLMGAICLYCCLISLTTSPATDASCAIDPLLGHVGFLALVGSLLAKTLMIKAQAQQLMILAQSKEGSVSRRQVTQAMADEQAQTDHSSLSEQKLISRLWTVLALYVAYWIVWMSVARPEPLVLKDGFTTYVVCRSPDAPGRRSDVSRTAGGVGNMFEVCPLLPLAFEVLLLVYTSIQIALSWTLPSAFNESRYILISVYNVLVLGGIMTMLVELFLPTPDFQLLFSGIGILLVTTIVTLVMFVPKVLLLLSPRSAQEAEARVSVTALGTVLSEHPTFVVPEGDESKISDPAEEPSRQIGRTGVVTVHLGAEQGGARIDETAPAVTENPPSSTGSVLESPTHLAVSKPLSPTESERVVRRGSTELVVVAPAGSSSTGLSSPSNTSSMAASSAPSPSVGEVTSSSVHHEGSRQSAHAANASISGAGSSDVQVHLNRTPVASQYSGMGWGAFNDSGRGLSGEGTVAGISAVERPRDRDEPKAEEQGSSPNSTA
jgi:hypothetical protein